MKWLRASWFGLCWLALALANGCEATPGSRAEPSTPAPAIDSGRPFDAGRTAPPRSTPTEAGTVSLSAPHDAAIAPMLPSDAGRHDAALVADAGAATATNACAGAVLCESFEASAMLDSSRFAVVMPSCSGDGTAAVVEDANAHSGKHVLRVQASGGYCNHVFVAPTALGSLPMPFHARFFVRFDQALGAGHATFVALHDAHEDKDLRLGGQNQVLIWNRESDDATLPELSPAGVALSVAPSAGAWHCIEFEIDAAARTMTTSFDGAVVAGLVLDAEPTPDIDSQWLRKTDWQPQLADVRFGWESYGDQGDTLAFDDLAIAAAPIGCDAAR